MRRADLARYALWCGIAATAEANRREYRMATTWLPHFAMNTLSLLLPDVLRLALPHAQPREASARGAASLLRETLAELACDNPGYVLYVAPLAAGYLLSAPWLNIYKGHLGDLRMAGFGLDALPHAATAFALSALVDDLLASAAGRSRPDEPLGRRLRRLNRHSRAVSASALALATLIWELGEYRIHRHELSRRGDAAAINMQWSLADTLTDCAANALGWLLAVIRRDALSGT